MLGGETLEPVAAVERELEVELEVVHGGGSWLVLAWRLAKEWIVESHPRYVDFVDSGSAGLRPSPANR